MAQKRIDRKKDLATGSVTFTNLENSESTTYSVDDVFGKGAWAALGALSNGAMAQQAMLHSLNAFGGDAAADKTVDAISAINARVQSVMDGNWTMRGEGSGSGPRVTVVDQAVAEVKGITPEEACAAIIAKAEATGVEPKDIRKGLRKNSRVAAAIAKIQADRAKAKAKAAGKEAADATDELEL